MRLLPGAGVSTESFLRLAAMAPMPHTTVLEVLSNLVPRVWMSADPASPNFSILKTLSRLMEEKPVDPRTQQAKARNLLRRLSPLGIELGKIIWNTASQKHICWDLWNNHIQNVKKY